MNKSNPIHARPSLYAYYFEALKEICQNYGYNLVLHGSMNRDLDLIAIPWQEEVGDAEQMVLDMCAYIGGWIQPMERKVNEKMELETTSIYRTGPHGRMQFIININRDSIKGYSESDDFPDVQIYIDLSVMPSMP